MINYFVGKTHCFAVNSKAAKHAVCYGIVKKDYPERLENISMDSDGLDTEFHDLTYITLIEQTETPEKPVLMLFRDPVERFVSACAMTHRTVANALANLSKLSVEDVNFIPQVEYTKSGQDTRLFKVPDQMDKFCAAAGFSYPLPRLNQSENEKPLITDEQKQAVQSFYALDMQLFNALGQEKP